MKRSDVLRAVGMLALVSMCAGCSTWNRMDSQERSTTMGATGGAVVGAAVGGPVGAAVGAGVGGVVGHEGAPAKR
jgi:YmgG-like glycine-zipper protein